MKKKGVTFQILTTCSLNCDLCMTLSPIYKKLEKNYVEPLESIKKSIDTVFGMYDFVDKIRISGGEPLLHYEIENIVNYFDKYYDCFGKLKLYTNGTILPSKDLDWSKNEKLEIVIADYGSKLSVNAKDLANYCRTHNINCRVNVFFGDSNNRHDEDDFDYGVLTVKDSKCVGWIDYGLLTNKESNDEKYVRNVFEECIFSSYDSITIFRGKAAICCIGGFAFDLGISTPKDGDVVDLHSCDSIESKRNQVKLLEARPNANCYKCNGCIIGSNNFPSAQQII